MQIEQGLFHADGDLCLNRREAEGDVVLRGKGGTDLDQPRKCREAVALNVNVIHPKRQAFGDRRALRVRLQTLSKLVGLTDQLHRALDRQTRWVGHGEPQLARVALTKLGGHPEEEEAGMDDQWGDPWRNPISGGYFIRLCRRPSTGKVEQAGAR